MTTTLSLAKTTRPGLPRVLLRERLFSLLDEGSERGITWVSGPPGAGKTTLVSSYLEERKTAYLWYQLDSEDDDPATFYHYLGQSAQKHAGSRAARLPVATAEQLRDTSAFARLYFRRLFGLLKPPFSLVFDNYQALAVLSDLHEVIQAALTEVPKRGHIVIISRSEPPANLARFRANREMSTIGWNELRLARNEVEEFIKLHGSPVPDEQIDQLAQHTEGWIAGLVLMLERSDAIGKIPNRPVKFVPQVIFDYLAGEIFDEFEPTAQDLLLQISFLSQVTASLAERLTRDSNTGALLLNLVRNNYFVSELPADPEPIFRAHPLFQDFLRKQFEQRFPSKQKKAIYTEAARLLEDTGQVEEAVRLLQKIGDWDGFTRLVKAQAPVMVAQSRTETLSDWLADVPGERLDADCWLLYWSGICRAGSASRESRYWFEKAFNAFSAEHADTEGLVLSCCGILDAIIHEMDDLASLDRWLDALQRILSENPGLVDSPLRNRLTASILFALLLRNPEHPQFSRWLEQAEIISRFPGSPGPLAVMSASSFLCSGNMDKAAEAIELADRKTSLHNAPEAYPAGLSAIKALVHLLKGEHEACLATALESRESEGEAKSRFETLLLSVCELACRLSTNDLSAVDSSLNQLHSYYTEAGRLGLCLYHYLRGWHCTLSRDFLDAYQHHKTALRIALELGIPVLEALCHLAIIQASVECGDTDSARLERRRTPARWESMANPLLIFIGRLTDAEIEFLSGDLDRGRKALGDALRNGRENGFDFFPCWRSSVLANLCARALEDSIENNYVRQLITTGGLVPDTSPLRITAWPWRYRAFSLGKFTLLSDDQPLVVSGKGQHRPLDLLKTLIALGGQDVRATQVATAIWPNVDSDYAYKSFTINLHRLRKLLEVDDAVLLREGRLTLNTGYFWVDTWALERITEAIDLLCQRWSGDKAESEAMDLARDMFRLYQGPFLEDEPDRPAFNRYRSKQRNKFQRSVSQLARYWEEKGDHERAIDIYLRGIECDGMVEGFYRDLMILFRRLDKRAEAIEVYERYREVLSASSDKKPAIETESIYRSLIDSNNQ